MAFQGTYLLGSYYKGLLARMTAERSSSVFSNCCSPDLWIVFLCIETVGYFNSLEVNHIDKVF